MGQLCCSGKDAPPSSFDITQRPAKTLSLNNYTPNESKLDQIIKKVSFEEEESKGCLKEQHSSLKNEVENKITPNVEEYKSIKFTHNFI